MPYRLEVRVRDKFSVRIHVKVGNSVWSRLVVARLGLELESGLGGASLPVEVSMRLTRFGPDEALPYVASSVPG